MTKKPKLSTVADEAGVSVATVSQVMRGAGRISTETREKVLAAADRLNYVPDGRAAAMRSGENREIGLVIQYIANPFNAEVISGASDLLDSEGYLLSVLDSRDSAEREYRNLRSFIRSSRGGLLWVPALGTRTETYALLATHKIPTVTFLRNAGHTELDHVGIKNTEATATATHYLMDLGHRHIAFLGGEANVQVRNERIAGYQSAMQERGLSEMVVWDSPDSKQAGKAAMLALWAEHPEITAIVCNGDSVALGASLAITEQGRKPGKDLSIVGFDDIQDAALAIPPLTTLAVSPYQLGQRLASVLLERIRQPDAPVNQVTVPAQLVIRQTTGAPRQATR